MNMKTISIISALLVTFTLASAQQADMKVLRSKYDSRLASLEAQAVTNKAAVFASYMDELQALKGRFQKAGDLENTKIMLAAMPFGNSCETARNLVFERTRR